MTANPRHIPSHARPRNSRTGRVWLVSPLCTAAAPTDCPAVRDHLMRTWVPVAGAAAYRSADGKHQTTWAQLHSQFDLVEVYPT